MITQNKNWQTDSDYSLQNRILKVCIDALLAVIPETLTCCSSCGFVWSTGRGTSTYIGGNGSVMIVQVTCWREGRLVILVIASFSCPWQGRGFSIFFSQYPLNHCQKFKKLYWAKGVCWLNEWMPRTFKFHLSEILQCSVSLL